MDVRDTLSTLMPPPRDDEPASLRQDIIDELSNHLGCTYNHELLRGATSSAARQRVLERFGDPAAMARRLWFDAMKGKIMAKRLVMASCLIVTLASVSLVFLVSIQSENRVAAELAQAQATNKDMLNKLSEMSEAIKNSRSLEWNPVKFTITEDRPDGPPAAGCSVSLILGDMNHKTTVRMSDSSGVADFGLVRPDQYSFQISRNWDQLTMTCYGSMNVTPGSQTDKRIVCPKTALEPVPMRIRCDWPADLANERLILYAPFNQMPIKQDGTTWNMSNWGTMPTHSALLGTDTALTEIRRPKDLHLWVSPSDSPSMKIKADILKNDLHIIRDSAAPMRWERGGYWLTQLIVLRLDHTQTAGAGRERFEVLARCYPQQSQFGVYEELTQPPSDADLRNPTRMRSGGIGIPGVVLDKKSWSKVATSFQALPDRLNEWTIVLPDELLKSVREKLKSTPTAP